MWEFLIDLVAPNRYMPHGNCYLWNSNLIWLHLLSDLFIALAYYSIPIMLVYFVYKQKDNPFNTVFILFGAFILSCGTTHLLQIWTLWFPAYWLSGMVKALTALISIYTAMEIFIFIPQALALPSTSQLEALNTQLQIQIQERKVAEASINNLNRELEKRVQERTEELKNANKKLRLEIQERNDIELALRKSKHFAEQITQLTPNIVYIYDLLDGQNIYCNSYTSEILGYTSWEIKTKKNFWQDIVHDEDFANFHQHYQSCLSLKEGQFLEIDYRVRDIHGKWYWLHQQDTVFEKGQDGQTKKIIGVATNITERKETELRLKEVNLKVEERVKELEQRALEMVRLGEMTDFLQGCLNLVEAKKALKDLLRPLFPHCNGAVFMIEDSGNLLEQAAQWGETSTSKLIFTANECWALRRGTYHISNSSSPNLNCFHINDECIPQNTLCVPMMAKSEILGLLYLSFNNCQQIDSPTKQLAETASKQIAITMANLKLRKKLEMESSRDPLTNLFNRRYLEISIMQEINRAILGGNPLGMMMIDIDHFKTFNDIWGHEAGDIVLQTVAKYLKKNIRSSDIACRYGGEELIIIMPDTSIDNMEQRAEKIRQDLQDLSVYYQSQLLEKITVSIGIAFFPQHGNSYQELLGAADRALYEAKKQGRNRVVVA